MDRPIRYVSIFSGIEAASVAWRPLGWEPVAFCEVDEYPCAVLAHRFPDVPNLGDITKVDWKEFKEQHGAISLVSGGSPCQSFSLAGKREGLKGASGLMHEYIRCVQELMPEWFVWENVAGALSVERGKAFEQLLASMDVLGYGLAWRVLDAQFCRVPMYSDSGELEGFFGPVAQRRRRLFLVGHIGDTSACEVLLESEGLRWDTPSSREKREELARTAGRSAYARGDAGSLNAWDVQSKRIFTPGSCCPTLNSGTSEGMNIQPSVLHSTEDGSGDAAYAMRTSQTGANGIGVDGEVAHTVDTTGPEGVAYTLKVRCGSDTYVKPDGKIGTAGKGALVGFESAFTIAATQDQTLVTMSSGQANAEISQDGVCTTLTCLHEAPIVFDRASFNQGGAAQYTMHIDRSETMDTLVARGPHGVCMKVEEG